MRGRPARLRPARRCGKSAGDLRRTSRMPVRRMPEVSGLAYVCSAHGRTGLLCAYGGGVTSKAPLARSTVRFALSFGRSKRE